MIEINFKKLIIFDFEEDGSNFTIHMLSNFEHWKMIDKADVIELISTIKTNEFGLYYFLLFFHLFLGVDLEPLYKELNDLEWKSDKCSKIHERFSGITYIFYLTSSSMMKKNRVSKTQLLEIRSKLIKQGLVPVRFISVELPYD